MPGSAALLPAPERCFQPLRKRGELVASLKWKSSGHHFFLLEPLINTSCLFLHIYRKAEPPAASAPSTGITGFIMLKTVKAAPKFQEGLSGLMPLALQSENLGLLIKDERLGKKRAIAGRLSVSFSQGERARGLQRPHQSSVTASSFCSPQLLC